MDFEELLRLSNNYRVGALPHSDFIIQAKAEFHKQLEAITPVRRAD